MAAGPRATGGCCAYSLSLRPAAVRWNCSPDRVWRVELALDLAERLRLALPPLAANTAEQLRQALPAFIPPANPLDVTAHGLVDPDLYRRTLPLILNDPQYGCLVLAIILTDEATSTLKLGPTSRL